MRYLASAFALVVGLTLSGCAGSQKPEAHAGSGSEQEPAAEEAAEDQTASTDTKSDESDNAAGADVSPASVAQEDEQESGECRKSDAKLALSVDRQSVNLEQGRLEAKMDGPICSIKMTITRKDGQPPIEKSFRYTGPERELTWNPVPKDQIEKIEIRITSDDSGYQSATLVPWLARIEHEEVEFDTNKAVIRASEVPSLEDSYAKVQEVLEKVKGKGLGTITLFIAGHTDTVGSAEANLDLSRRRAQAIASWFMKRGVCAPIAFDGFGETALAKMTGDEVEAQENRRVDYILSVEPPPVSKGARPAWKWVSRGC